jgi:hypothetical protein
LTAILDDLVSTVGAHYTRVGQSFVIDTGRPSKSKQPRKYVPQPEKQYGR